MVQDFEPTAECIPAGQALQGTMPESEAMPPGQRSVQEDAPASDEKPAGHLMHALEPAFE
jgi:hypothetical protein